MAHQHPDQPPLEQPDELRRRFDALVSAGGLDDLRHSALSDLLPDVFARRTQNPHLRGLRRGEPVLYRVHVGLREADPPIWRRLELRSDLGLDAVHEVLLAAYSWGGGHLHRFAVGGDCFDSTAEWFLCPFDVAEGDDLGTPDHEVQLDEVLNAPGDVLHYVYDYGDEWDLVLRLEEVLPLEPGTPSARCTGGERAAPPEDCGGLREAEELADLLSDPAAFDAAEVNALLDQAAAVAGLRPDLAELLHALRRSSVGADLLLRATLLGGSGDSPATSDLTRDLGAIQWFLDRAADGGIPLTAAGYLKPVEVEAAAAILPLAQGWPGKANREDQTTPVLRLRHALQGMRLVRKHRGHLVLTPAGRAAQVDPSALWEHLRLHLVGGDVSTVEVQGRLLTLLLLASGTDPRPADRVAEALTALGWREPGGQPVTTYTATWFVQDVRTVLGNIGEPGGSHPRVPRSRRPLSPTALALARAALRAWSPS